MLNILKMSEFTDSTERVHVWITEELGVEDLYLDDDGAPVYNHEVEVSESELREAVQQLVDGLIAEQDKFLYPDEAKEILARYHFDG